jgi:hypothetical protein
LLYDEERALPVARQGGNPKYLKHKGVGYRQRGLVNLAVPPKVPEVQGNRGITKAALAVAAEKAKAALHKAIAKAEAGLTAWEHGGGMAYATGVHLAPAMAFEEDIVKYRRTVETLRRLYATWWAMITSVPHGPSGPVLACDWTGPRIAVQSAPWTTTDCNI